MARRLQLSKPQHLLSSSDLVPGVTPEKYFGTPSIVPGEYLGDFGSKQERWERHVAGARRVRGAGRLEQRGQRSFRALPAGWKLQDARTFRTWDEADDWLIAVATGQIGPDVEHTATFNDLWKAFRKHFEYKITVEKTHSPHTLYQYGVSWRSHLEPFFGERRVAEVNRAEIREFIPTMRAYKGTWREQPLGIGSQRQVMILLSALFKFALGDESGDWGIDDSPARNLTGGMGVSQQEIREKILTEEQVWEIYDVLPEHWQLLPILLGFCGMRIGEGLGIAPHALTENGWLHLSEQVQKTQPHCRLKGREERDVPVGSAVIEAFRDHCKRHANNEFVFYRPRSLQRATNRPFYTRDDLRPVWDEWVKDLFPGRKVQPHDLRHTAVAVWRDKGFTLDQCSRFLGHKSIVTTEKYYDWMFKTRPENIDMVGRRSSRSA